MPIITAKQRKIPEILTEQERQKLLFSINNNSLIGLRNLCMLTLMVDIGLRISEVINLCNGDINWISGKMIVRQGKGNRDRVLWLNDNDLNLLAQWREKRPVKVDLLFTTLQGRPVYDVYVRQFLRRLAKKAGITKNIHPHTLRHTFATDLYRETKDLRLVQKALGHADISTTMIYTHIVDDQLEEALKNLRRGEKAAAIA